MSPSAPRKLLRAACFLIAPIVSLILFRRAFHMWFFTDDFAWLGLRLQVHRPAELWPALFTPQAQGTVRFLSERLFFLVFSSLFGLNALPFHLFVFITWCVDLTLGAIVGARLTGSRAAGFIAAILWSAHAALSRPLLWASAYNEVLYALCLLAALYARMRWIEDGHRKWIGIEWMAYLAGFGANELIVVYPALAALHAICYARKRFLSTLPLFIPAAIFSIAHVLLIPKAPGVYYVIALDQRVWSTLVHYWNQAIEPARISDLPHAWLQWIGIAGILTAITLLAFALAQFRRRNNTGLFCIGWFLVSIAPVLLLPNHLTDYYLLLPVLGLAWLGAGTLSAAWIPKGSFGILARAATIVFAAVYFIGSYRAIDIYTNWLDSNSSRIRDVFESAEEVVQNHPGNTILLARVDSDLYNDGFDSRPFRLAGLTVRLAPGEEQQIQTPYADSLHFYVITPAKALDLIAHDRARVLDVSRSPMRDVTRTYANLLHANPDALRRDFVDAGDPEYASQLGPSGAWFGQSAGFQWMGKSGVVKLAGIGSDAQTLSVTGFNPGAEYTHDPVTLTFKGNGRFIGSATISKLGEQFSISLPLPPELRGVKDIEIQIDLDRVIRRPGSDQEFGIVFGTFAIR